MNTWLCHDTLTFTFASVFLFSLFFKFITGLASNGNWTDLICHLHSSQYQSTISVSNLNYRQIITAMLATRCSELKQLLYEFNLLKKKCFQRQFERNIRVTTCLYFTTLPLEDANLQMSWVYTAIIKPWFKATTTTMKYFARSSFSRNLVHLWN